VRRLAIVLVIAAALAGPAGATAQKPRAADLPPISFTCPMHPDIVEDHSGTCPRCGMDLTPVRLDSAYSCPVHTTVIETDPGRCRVCRRTLVRVTVALFWTCAGQDGLREINPGRCADGRPRTVVRDRRAHGDHNPRHGGQFFMASDNWHHLEGTYPSAGVFRLFVYDDFTRPIALDGIAGRAVTREQYDPETKTYADVTAFALTRSKSGRYLEARVPPGLPMQLTAKIRFAVGTPEHRFDFSFPSYTIEPPPGAAPAAPTPAAAAARIEATPGDEAQQTTASLIASLKARNGQVETLFARGEFAQLYIPALAAKDMALALDARASELPGDRRTAASAAVHRIVLSAWLIDLYGDLGDKPKLADACRTFAEAVAELTADYAR
jgi:heavy metal-binding protein